MLKKKISIFVAVFILLSAVPVSTKATVDEFCSLNNFSLQIDEKTIQSGYTVKAFDDKFVLGIFPGVLQSQTRVELKNITKHTPKKKFADSPEGWVIASDVFEYNLSKKESYNSEKPFVLEIKFDETSIEYKKIFFYDGTAQEWKPLPTTIDWNNNKVRSQVYFPYLKLALFNQSGIAGKGKSSWYNQKRFIGVNGNYAASQQYPRGTKVKVINLQNDKSVIVKINDYGPEKWTGRIIDLDVSAFEQLAWKGLGVINVSIEPVE